MVELAALAAQIERQGLTVPNQVDEERGPPSGLPLEGDDLAAELLLDPGEGTLPFGVEFFAAPTRLRGVRVFGRVPPAWGSEGSLLMREC